jgi:macrolide transport system ATP-binding/permease protein
MPDCICFGKRVLNGARCNSPRILASFIQGMNLNDKRRGHGELHRMILPGTVLQDLRYGIRMLFRNAGFTAVSVLALALGIGVNTGTFTAYKALVGRSLDARDPGRMVNLTLILQSGASSFLFSYPDYEAYRHHVRSCSGLIAWSNNQLTLTDAGGIISERTAAAGSLLGRLGLLPPAASNAEFASTFLVSENYFSVLGVAPLRGRSFESIAASELAASPSVLISENYWQKRFAGDPAVLGKTVRLNNVPFTIVGITPHDFSGTSMAVPDFWLPLSLEPLVHPDSNPLHDRENLHLRVFGRLAPDIEMRQAGAEMTLLAGKIRSLHDPNSELSRPAGALISRGSPLPGRLPSSLKFTILLIMVAAGMVMVVACANVASLQLARATTRQSELSMRLSLGASRGRLVRQLLTESALLGLLAGVIALPCTWAILKAGATLFTQAFPIEVGTIILHVAPDFQVFAYLLAISVFSGLLFGLTPAIESSRSALFSAIKPNAGSSPLRSRRLRDVLIASQVAMSLVLMIAGSMLTRSALHTLAMRTGYDGKHVVDLDFRFPEGSKYSAERKVAVIQELRTRIAALPGVARITSARAPDDNNVRSALVSLNGEKPSSGNMQGTLYYTWIQPNYFQTLGVPLVLGTGFQTESGQPERSAIVSESAARRLWPGRNPIGHILSLGTERQFHTKEELLPDGPVWKVIGVAGDTRGVEMDGSDSAQIYLPLPEDRLRDYPILIRTQSDPMLVIRAIDSVMSSVDPDLVSSTSTLQEMLRQTPPFLGSAFAAAVAITVSLFGLLLASMGIWGTVSYIVVLRTREIGIRMAVGAQKRDVLGLVLRESTRPVLFGLIVGMVLAIGASYLLRGILFGLGRVDGVSFVGVSFLFLTIALLAAYPPSRRAMRVDPMVALRYE